MNTAETTTQAEIGSPVAKETENETHRHNDMPLDGERDGFLSAGSVSGMTREPRWDQ